VAMPGTGADSRSWSVTVVPQSRSGPPMLSEASATGTSLRIAARSGQGRQTRERGASVKRGRPARPSR
jgi:hypothetical protein